MNKLVAGIALFLGMQTIVAAEQAELKNDIVAWFHITNAAHSMLQDSEFQEALKDIVTATQKAAVIGTQKLAIELSDDQKEKVVELVSIVRSMFQEYAAAVMAGNSDHSIAVDQATQKKINELGNRMLVLIMPFVILSQNPAFVEANQEVMNAVRAHCLATIGQTIDTVEQELAS